MMPLIKPKDGVFRLRVIEGFVKKVIVEGEIRPVRQRAQASLDEVTRAQPARIQDLEQYLLLVTDIPGRASAAGVLRPDKERIGASELIVKVTRKPFEGCVLANNPGVPNSLAAIEQPLRCREIRLRRSVGPTIVPPRYLATWTKRQRRLYERGRALDSHLE